MIKLSIHQYFCSVVLRCVFVLTVSLPLCLLVKYMLPEGILPTIIVCATSVLVASSTSYLLGLDKGERQFVNTKSMEFIHKFARR